eukprot:8514000-Pyramimonas_sp.AAC.1
MFKSGPFKICTQSEKVFKDVALKRKEHIMFDLKTLLTRDCLIATLPLLHASAADHNVDSLLKAEPHRLLH